MIIGLIMLSSCQKSEYHQMVTRELASGERHDELFLGLSLGMTGEEFYETCWDLHKSGKMRQSTRNNAVLWPVDSVLTAEFYPTFNEAGVIVEMPVLFNYTNYNPFDKSMNGAVLVKTAKALLENWYGAGFIPFGPDDRKVGWVKVDGNRRVVLTKRDEISAKAVITDLTAEVAEETLARGLK